MSDHLISDIWIVGAGTMAIAHARVLERLGRTATVIGRGPASAARFEAETGWPVRCGGIGDFLATCPAPAAAAVVAVDALELEPTATALLRHGVKRLLVEKPAGVDPASIRRLATAAQAAGGQVFVAYNRRFFASVREARRLIELDGGVTSFSFEFTELAALVGSLPHPPEVKANWFLANSSHVVDLAFHLGGRPASIESLVIPGLEWHPVARFAGCGSTAAGAIFHYGADWTSAGRWGVEINTPSRRLILRPMESLQVQMAGTFKIEEVTLDNEVDKTFKPGFLGQMQAFLGGECSEHLIDVEAHIGRVENEFAAILSGGTYRAPSKSPDAIA